MRRPSPWMLLSVTAAVLALAGTVSEFHNPPGGDPASLLYAAGRILDGTRLYHGLVDLNPPFTFLFHIPFVLLARATGLPVIAAFRLGVLLLIVIAGLSLWGLLRGSAAGPGVRHALAAGFLLGSLGLVVGFFGEREHLQFVLMFPYLAVSSLRAWGDRPSGRLMAWTGALAGVGLALKVTAGAVPVLVGLVIWLWQREWSGESAWALVMMAICTAGAMLWAPGYVAEVRTLGRFYHGFAVQPVMQLFQGGAMMWPIWAALVVVLLGIPAFRQRLSAGVWLAAMDGFLVSVAVQGKGFPYHYYTADASALTLILLVMALEARAFNGADALRRAVSVAGVAVAAALPLAIAWARLNAPVREVDDFGLAAYELLKVAPPGTRVAVQSSRLGDAFPLLVDRRLQLTGRFPHLWFLYPYDTSAVYHGRGTRPYTDSALSPLERELRRDVGEDLQRYQPSLMLVRDPGSDRTVLRYLCDDRVFREAASGYRLERSTDVMQLFRRDTSGTTEGACASL